MKKVIWSVVILLIIIVSYVYITNYRVENKTIGDAGIYTNSKFNYQLALPQGWYVLDESPDGQNLVITNNTDKVSASKSMFGPDKIDISLTHLEPDYISNIQESNTSEKVLQKIVFNQGYKGFLREELNPAKSGTVVSFDFEGKSLLTTGEDSGKTANGMVILLSGAVNKEIVMNLANSFKVTR